MCIKRNVLLIEDDKIILSFVSTALNGNDYRVVTASTGQEGLSLAASM